METESSSTDTEAGGIDPVVGQILMIATMTITAAVTGTYILHLVPEYGVETVLTWNLIALAVLLPIAALFFRYITRDE